MTERRLCGARRRHAKRCESKTACGNVFATEAPAVAAAVRLRNSKLWLRAYQCKHCGKWHIGKAYKVAMWAAATNQKL